MDADQVNALRALLAPTGWLERTRAFARVLRSSSRSPGGLLLVGTPDEEPWHLAAHLDEESRFAGIPGLAPTLVRWRPAQDGPDHLRIGLERLEAAQRGEALFVVSPQAAPVPLLERVSDARKAGAVILAMDQGDKDLEDLAHEALTVRAAADPVTFDAAQHLVSAAAGEPHVRSGQPAGLRGLRSRLARLLDTVSGPPPE
ncbi:MAG TPA: hypothetical protein VGL63_02555 [Streptosporangiaceae bacterium]